MMTGKRIFILEDGQVVYSHKIVFPNAVETIEANDIPDELFFDALVNTRLYDFDHGKKIMRRNKKKRGKDEAPPVVESGVLELKKK